MLRLVLFGFFFLVAGCMVGPDYRRPASEIPPGYRFQDQGSQSSADLPWWKEFHDPVLDTLIAERDAALAAHEIRQHICIAPSMIAQFCPAIEVTALPAHIQHAVDRAASAQ